MMSLILSHTGGMTSTDHPSKSLFPQLDMTGLDRYSNTVASFMWLDSIQGKAITYGKPLFDFDSFARVPELIP